MKEAECCSEINDKDIRRVIRNMDVIRVITENKKN
jgi:hypothetical protein